MSHTLHLLSSNCMQVTSWCLTLQSSFLKPPFVVCFSFFLHYSKKVAVQPQRTMDPTTRLPDTNYWANWRQSIECFETMQKERRIQDPYTLALYLQPLSVSPNYMIPLIPQGVNTHSTPTTWIFVYPHFTAKETDAQRDNMTTSVPLHTCVLSTPGVLGIRRDG